MTPARREAAELSPVVRRFIEDMGNTTQSFGIGRVLGQIYAYLYFSPEPRNLADMQEALGISKGSASTGVRQLEQWEAVRKIWVKGDRKDYYEANDWLGKILKSAMLDLVAKRISAYSSLLNGATTDLIEQMGEDGEAAFVRERIGHLRSFYDRTQRLWSNPIVQRLLK